MMLMEEAERIARDEHGSTRLAVISGIESVFLAFFFFFLLATLPFILLSNRPCSPGE